jgi:hypothetical protein
MKTKKETTKKNVVVLRQERCIIHI